MKKRLLHRSRAGIKAENTTPSNIIVTIQPLTKKTDIDLQTVHVSLPPVQNGYLSLLSCSLTPSSVIGLSMKPLAPVFHASRA